jgi:hypothetical protein
MAILRQLLRALAVLPIAVLAVTLPPLAQAQTPAKKPNIVMIMGDDIGWANIGAYNQGVMSMRTPNLDRLAAEGMMFTQAHSSNALCSPSRYALLTGNAVCDQSPFVAGQMFGAQRFEIQRRRWAGGRADRTADHAEHPVTLSLPSVYVFRNHMNIANRKETFLQPAVRHGSSVLREHVRAVERFPSPCRVAVGPGQGR